MTAGRPTGLINTVGILTKPRFDSVTPTLQELVTWLRGRGKDVILDPKSAALIGEPPTHRKTQIALLCDLILVLGGDGTMLNAARLSEERSVPIMGVNMGGLGFLTEVTVENLFPSLDRIFAGEYVLDERVMLRGRIDRHGEHVAQGTVLNDIVVSKGNLARMIELEIKIDGQFVTNLRGDGLIVSTPTGSTAYSLSAGGPIIEPSVEALILTPISPHTLSHRPLVISSTVELEVTLTSHDEGAMTTFDGQVGIAVGHGDTLLVKASEYKSQLVRFPEKSYYEVLRKKLRWGNA